MSNAEVVDVKSEVSVLISALIAAVTCPTYDAYISEHEMRPAGEVRAEYKAMRTRADAARAELASEFPKLAQLAQVQAAPANTTTSKVPVRKVAPADVATPRKRVYENGVALRGDDVYTKHEEIRSVVGDDMPVYGNKTGRSCIQAFEQWVLAHPEDAAELAIEVR